MCRQCSTLNGTYRTSGGNLPHVLLTILVSWLSRHKQKENETNCLCRIERLDVRLVFGRQACYCYLNRCQEDAVPRFVVVLPPSSAGKGIDFCPRTGRQRLSPSTSLPARHSHYFNVFLFVARISPPDVALDIHKQTLKWILRLMIILFVFGKLS